MSRKELAITVGCIALVMVLVAFALFEDNEPKQIESEKSPNTAGTFKVNNGIQPASENFEASTGWTITSYQDDNEVVYTDNKIEVSDSNGNSLGFYKSDFLEQIKIDGSGKGDGIRNSGKYLHYDYNVDNGKTYYLVDKSLGAYENELVPWTGDRPSIAVNPPLPKGTEIQFKDLGPEGEDNPDWVITLLKSKTFYADDKFYGVTGKKIDVYVGLQKTKNMDGTPESLSMHNVTIYIKRK